MRKWSFCIKLILMWINILSIGAENEDICEKCLKIEDCGMFVSITKEEQQKWSNVASCDGSQNGTGPFSFSSTAIGDYVCCPNKSLWGTDILNLKNNITSFKNITEQTLQSQIRPKKNSERLILKNSNRIFYFPDDVNYLNPNVQRGYNPTPIQGIYIPNPNSPGNQNIQRKRQNGISNQHIYNNQQYPLNSEIQCTVRTSLLPDPGTGCCGQDMFEIDIITDLQSILNRTSRQNNNWSRQPSLFYPGTPYYGQRKKRFAENETILEENFSIDLRITGGTETELDQFPWTVLLRAIFVYGNRSTSTFNCGGSLISPKYVLTAGHCVYIKSATISELQVILAEYDKRTFPRDCKSSLGEKKKCIDNVLMYAEHITIHGNYDDTYLHNDIALVRLRGYAPYTRFIRPICLPPININIDDYANLPLAVAGWGRNGNYNSNIKQSTVVRLVSPFKCKATYSSLLATQLCAAGRNGQDTCSGDSGGPIMMLYRGTYYVVGIVSGKTLKSPCGSRVPSLYTNVYDYVPWIKQNISN